MNNEIKEILDRLEKKKHLYQIAIINDWSFNDDDDYEANLLLDYITNLQEENERLKEWKKDLLNENIELENIRKEAREYLKSNEWSKDYELSYCRTHLLNILKGENNG